MDSQHIDEVMAQYIMLQSPSASNTEDSLEWNIHHTQAMWVQIAAEMSKLQEKPIQQANQTNQVVSLQEKDQQFTEIMEEEIAHWDQVSVLSSRHL